MNRERTRRAVLAGVATATAAGLAGCNDDVIDVPGDDSGSEPRSAVVGEVVEGDRLAMVVREVSETTDLGSNRTAGEGNVFEVVRLAVKNVTGDEFLAFSGFLQTAVEDDAGTTHDQILATSARTLNGGQLAPGEVSRGDVVYEVPADATGLVLQFDFEGGSFFDYDRVTVDLDRTASAEEGFDQTLRVPIHAVGESVSYEGVTVAVNRVETRSRLGPSTTPSAGNEFVVVDLTTTNGTGQEQTVSTLLQMLVKDGRGRSYTPSVSGTSELDRAYDERTPLADGETRSGTVAYEVPRDARPLYFTFEFTLWVDGDKTFWQLR